MQRKAQAVWKGTLKEGTGTISTDSRTLDNTRYDFRARFENGGGTNPEELIAAAHAGCFTMALSGMLEKANLKPELLETQAAVTLDRVNEQWTVTKIHLDVSAKLSPNSDEKAFQAAAEKAKAECPISRLLKAEITMKAHLAAAAQK